MLNTRLKWALWTPPSVGACLLARHCSFWRTSRSCRKANERLAQPPRWVLACVVAGDAVRRRVEQQLEIWDVHPRWVVSSLSEAGLTNGYDHPSRLGADRWWP